MGFKETGNGYMKWIHVAQDRNQWRAFVNTVMKFSFQKNGVFCAVCSDEPLLKEDTFP
jgi:hypothetical protein